MAKKETTSPAIPVFPMLKTVEQMSKISGIGENKLRELMDSGELEYIQNGNEKCSYKNQIRYQRHHQYCNRFGVVENSSFSAVCNR